MNKSVVIFTNFWDANSVIDFRYLLLHDKKNEKLYRIHLLKKNVPENFSVHSIALSHPDLSKQSNMKDMDRIDFLCPTYDMLKRYKKDHNWDAYQKDFIKLIKKRKDDIKEWAESLKPDWVYFLCCWENTSHGAHCHREILYKAFTESKIMSNKIISIYRHGDKNYKKEINGRNYAEAMMSTRIWNLPPMPSGTYDSITITSGGTATPFITGTGSNTGVIWDNISTLPSLPIVLDDGTLITRRGVLSPPTHSNPINLSDTNDNEDNDESSNYNSEHNSDDMPSIYDIGDDDLPF